LFAAIAAAGCGGYDAPDEVTFGSVAYTQQAPGFDFKPLNTYYLDPQMEVWHDGELQPAFQPVPPQTLDLINQKMAAYGWTAVTQTPGPGQAPASDVGMRLAYFKTTYTYYYSGGYCSIYWAYYACWPGYAYAGQYTTGTVLTMMIDTKAPVNQTKVLWVSALYAVLLGSTIEDTPRLNTAMARAFDQSPYLNTK